MKKREYSKLVTKLDDIDTTDFVKKLNMKKMNQTTYFDAEFTKVNDKVDKNSSGILLYKSRLKQNGDTVHNLERYASYLRGKNFFGHDGTQNYLVFQLMYEKNCRRLIRKN